MKTRLVFLAFCVTACLSVLLTTPVSAACQDINEQIHKHMEGLSEMDRQKEELLIQFDQTDDTTQKQDIEALLKEIDQNRDTLRETLGELERQFSECESQAGRGDEHNPNLNQDPNGDDGFSPLIIAAIIGASGAVLAALIGLLMRRQPR
jgi:uncharacterized membrane protein YvbJ